MDLRMSQSRYLESTMRHPVVPISDEIWYFLSLLVPELTSLSSLSENRNPGVFFL